MWYVVSKDNGLPVSKGFDSLTLAELEKEAIINALRETFPDCTEDFEKRLDMAFFSDERKEQ